MLPDYTAVLASSITAGDRIVRDGVVVAVAAADQTVPRRTLITLDSGGKIDVGKATKLDKVTAVDDQLEALKASVTAVRTASIAELSAGQFITWHKTPHRIVVINRAAGERDGIPLCTLTLRPWRRDAADVVTDPLVAACRFVVVDQPDEILPANTEAAVEEPAGGDTPAAPVDDAAERVARINALNGPADIAAAGKAIRDRGDRVEQVRPAPAAAAGGYTLLVEIFRPVVTARIYSDATINDSAVDPVVTIVDDAAPMTAEQALQAHRDTLDLIDRDVDDRPGWAAAGPWNVDVAGGFLIVFSRPVVVS